MKLLLTILLFFTCFKLSAQDTTYVTQPTTHDTAITTTIPAKIIHIGDSTIIISDSSYNVYYNNQHYATVDGSVTTTIPLYDTIPAHDTTFITTTTHDTTVIVIIPPAEENIYGMFPNNGETTFGQRLQVTLDAACNAFRYNFDYRYTHVWQVQQVRDAGLKVLMTYNSSDVRRVDYFPTGAELTTQLNGFDSALTANSSHLPDVLFINNEEPNFNYWKGTASDYMAWLNGCVTISHNHGVPISNGGILVNIVYYIRAVYKAEGKTDSANLITALGNLPPGVGAAQQVIIDWYNVEIPALAASGVDYINMHWYEPTFFNDANSTTTSGLIPLVVRFLQSRTGKPVVTHEFGSKGPSQILFNATADEFKNAGVKIMVYYAGNGPVASDNRDFWQVWILQ